MKEAIVPKEHPNRRGYKLDGIQGYIVHSTANLNLGTGDEFHARYFSRNWQALPDGFMEADGKTPFRTGCTHLGADEDSLTLYIPLNEYAPGAGDRPLPDDGMNHGQRPLARIAFANRQNWRTLQIEICEAGGWNQASADRAKAWIIEDAKARGLRVDLLGSLLPVDVNGPPKPGTVLILRHYDLTGKPCPSYFVSHKGAWEAYVREIAASVNG